MDEQRELWTKAIAKWHRFGGLDAVASRLGIGATPCRRWAKGERVAPAPIMAALARLLDGEDVTRRGEDGSEHRGLTYRRDGRTMAGTGMDRVCGPTGWMTAR